MTEKTQSLVCVLQDFALDVTIAFSMFYSSFKGSLVVYYRECKPSAVQYYAETQ